MGSVSRREAGLQSGVSLGERTVVSAYVLNGSSEYLVFLESFGGVLEGAP